MGSVLDKMNHKKDVLTAEKLVEVGTWLEQCPKKLLHPLTLVDWPDI
jgi:hypothetical protein